MSEEVERELKCHSGFSVEGSGWENPIAVLAVSWEGTHLCSLACRGALLPADSGGWKTFC